MSISIHTKKISSKKKKINRHVDFDPYEKDQ